jgi:hypothetical protein
MPRRRLRDPEPPRRGRPVQPFDAAAVSSRLLGPAWARTEGYQVRTARSGEKRYRCPYCEGWIVPGTPHVVAIPEGRAEDRRHYHTPCWERESGTKRPERG